MRPFILLLLVLLIVGFCYYQFFFLDTGNNYNVIVILIDALRFDHLGCYGYKRNTSPNIDKISEKSLVFENAISQATWTKPSVTSLFISDYVKNHGITLFTLDNTDYSMSNVLPDSAITLAEVFSDDGYKTKAVISNPFIKKGFGLEQGFDEYDFTRKDHDETLNALRWIKKILVKNFFYISIIWHLMRIIVHLMVINHNTKEKLIFVENTKIFLIASICHGKILENLELDTTVKLDMWIMRFIDFCHTLGERIYLEKLL